MPTVPPSRPHHLSEQRPREACLEPLDDGARLRPRWEALQARTDGPFFLAWPWIANALSTPGARPWLFSLREGDQDIALGLLWPMTERRHGWLRVRQLRLHEAGPDPAAAIQGEYQTLLCLPGREDVAWQALLTALHGPGAPAWDELVVTNALHSLEDRLRGWHPRIHRRAESGSGAVDLTRLRSRGITDLNGYIDTLGKNTRAQLQRSLRRYAQRGSVRLERVTAVPEALKAFDELARRHTAKWHALGRPGLLDLPVLCDFHRRLIAAEVEAGGVEVLRCRAGDAPFAWLYNLVDAKRVLFNVGGFEPETDKHLKPGLLAHALAIESHLQAGRDIYDFLAGDDRYKTNLGQPGPRFVSFALQRGTPGLRLESALRRVKHRLLRPARATGSTHDD